jgi:hypothetical protein
MRAVGTYFEQVPKTVIDKILAQRDRLAEDLRGSAEAVKKSEPGKAASKATARNPKH